MAEEKKPGAAYAMFGLNESEPRQATPGAAPAQPQPGAPQYVYVQGPPPTASGGGKGLPIAVGILLVISLINLGLVIFGWQKLDGALSKHTDQLDLLTRRMDASDDRYAQLKAQFQVTAEKLGMTQQELSRSRQLASEIQKQQKQAVRQLNAAIQQKASAKELNQLASDSNAKIGNLSGDLAGTKKDLEATKEALTGAKGELSGAIARTHDELVALAHRTDRDYFEFNIQKRHERQKIGTVMLELQKTDTKRNLYTINLFFDDKRTVRRNNAIDSPVFFYVQGAPSALELVVNKLGKSSIAGYVSAPKGFFTNTPNVLTSRPTT
jgi:predicted  nucleic acid-binding Zn-ribbon protein